MSASRRRQREQRPTCRLTVHVCYCSVSGDDVGDWCCGWCRCFFVFLYTKTNRKSSSSCSSNDDGNNSNKMTSKKLNKHNTSKQTKNNRQKDMFYKHQNETSSTNNHQTENKSTFADERFLETVGECSTPVSCLRPSYTKGSVSRQLFDSLPCLRRIEATHLSQDFGTGYLYCLSRKHLVFVTTHRWFYHYYAYREFIVPGTQLCTWSLLLSVAKTLIREFPLCEKEGTGWLFSRKRGSTTWFYPASGGVFSRKRGFAAKTVIFPRFSHFPRVVTCHRYKTHCTRYLVDLWRHQCTWQLR